MSRVVVHVALSLDGCMAGPGVGVESPMGEGGLALHDWLLASPQDPLDARMAREMTERTGAVVVGRRTFDVGIGAWQDTPYPAPAFVVTHRPRAPLVQRSGVFTFIDAGVGEAVRVAKAAAGERCVVLMGAQIARQALAQGLVDELNLQLVPRLLGDGLRLFGGSGDARLGFALEQEQASASSRVVHLRYRVHAAEGSAPGLPL